MNIPHLHDWNISAAEAIALQKQMTAQIDYHRPIDLDAIRLVAGVDVSVHTDAITGVAASQAAVVVLSYPDMQVIETALAQMPTPFPYIPGLLSFREGPVLEIAFAKLEHEPDAFIFDGMGRAHPRRIGIASHMGLWLQKPTIGCGKTLLTGHFQEPVNERGAFSDLVDRGEVIGAVLRTRANVKPVFISVGHLADLATSVKLVMRCTSKYRLPDPIRAAHNAAGAF
ncbi:MAG: deoxyribonuclease V [Anaerolineae bacterium]|nr:deoxyribonuclease V [Anaerolineae bacterium]